MQVYMYNLQTWVPPDTHSFMIVNYINVCVWRTTNTVLRWNCTKIEHVLCAISKQSTLFWKMIKAHPEANCLRNSKIVLRIYRPCSSWAIDPSNILHILFNNSKTVSSWPTKYFNQFCEFFNLLENAYIIFQKSFDNYKTVYAQNMLNFG